MSDFKDMNNVLSVKAIQEIAEEGMAHSTAWDKTETLAYCSLGEHAATEVGLDNTGHLWRVCLCCGQVICSCEQ